MAAISRKNLRSKRSKRSTRSKRGVSRRHRGGGLVDVYFMMDSKGMISNVYSADPSLTVTPAAAGKVNIVSTVPTLRINGIMIHAMKGASPTWPADAALMTAKGFTGTKLVLAKGSSSLGSTTPAGFKFNSDPVTKKVIGTLVAGANLNLAGMFGTAVWGTQNPNPTGAAPPNAPPGTPNVNTRIRFTVV